jgi:hypothetical protein
MAHQPMLVPCSIKHSPYPRQEALSDFFRARCAGTPPALSGRSQVPIRSRHLPPFPPPSAHRGLRRARRAARHLALCASAPPVQPSNRIAGAAGNGRPIERLSSCTSTHERPSGQLGKTAQDFNTIDHERFYFQTVTRTCAVLSTTLLAAGVRCQ